MKHNTRTIAYGALTIVGAACFLAGCLGYADGTVAGFGGALIAVSVIFFAKEMRYAKDADYAKRIDASENDERLSFLVGKAAGATFQLTFVGLAVLSLVLPHLGYAEVGRTLGVVMGIEVLIYWLSYLVLSKKY